MLDLPYNENVSVQKLERVLEYDNMSSSYKAYWFLGIFQEVIRGNQIIKFKKIVCRMISSAWYPIIQYHLNLGVNDKLSEIVLYVYNKYNLSPDIKEDELLYFLEGLDDDEFIKNMKKFYNLVPYRLLTPFYSDHLTGLKDWEKNRIITQLSNGSDHGIYRINTEEKEISINNNWFKYIYENQSIINGWLKYKLIYYLQKKNPNVPAIPLKLAPTYKRELSRAKIFWDQVNKEIVLNDIYTGRPFTKDNLLKYGQISIDHFIPWSFVLHDELWNLVPTFKNINSSKSNKLPRLEEYINKFCDIQYDAFCVIRYKKASKQFLEDYLTINKKLDINLLLNANRGISKEEFSDSLNKTIMPLFQIAYNQGYEIWNNKEA